VRASESACWGIIAPALESQAVKASFGTHPGREGERGSPAAIVDDVGTNFTSLLLYYGGVHLGSCLADT